MFFVQGNAVHRLGECSASQAVEGTFWRDLGREWVFQSIRRGKVEIEYDGPGGGEIAL